MRPTELQETEDYLKRAFDYQESELAAARKRYTDKAREGNRRAGVELESHQATTAHRRRIAAQQALLQARREVELIQSPAT
jgi:hypothetical protein